jgi:hypothetical protein
VCRDVTVDASNCGGCGTVCPSGRLCAAGACACPAPLLDCAGSCRNTQTDPLGCGACGVACPAGQACNLGLCVGLCGAGQSNCSGSCRTLATDTAHCGACGNVCPTRANATTTCAGGACGFTCVAGFRDCNGNATDGCEVNLQSDVANCGSCGNVCGTACSAGACVVTGRTIPGFSGQLGPDYSSQGWSQCVGYFDQQNADDIPNTGWASPCASTNYHRLRMACGANANSVRFIDVSRNLFAVPPVSYPESNLIYNFSFTSTSPNAIYASNNDPNNNTSWWNGGDGCNENATNLTINNGCGFDASNCFGQGITGSRYLYVYVQP